MVYVSFRSTAFSAGFQPPSEPRSEREVFTSLASIKPSAIRSHDRSGGTWAWWRDGAGRLDDGGLGSAGNHFEVGTEFTALPDPVSAEVI
ncbi:hypothetical protein SCOR_23990 [Sulfidibacter corallicola]